MATLTTTPILIPTKAQVDALKEGDEALDCFGQYRPITRIYARGTDRAGKVYCCFYTAFGDRGTGMSGDYHEGQLVRTVRLCTVYTSAQLAQIERTGAIPA